MEETQKTLTFEKYVLQYECKRVGRTVMHAQNYIFKKRRSHHALRY